MKTLLQINSSIQSESGQSTRLADRFTAAWRLAHPDGHVIVRDLARTPVPHLDADTFQAFLSQPAARTPAQQAALDRSDALIAELRAADTVVFGLPLYNFGLPSDRKSTRLNSSH